MPGIGRTRATTILIAMSSTRRTGRRVPGYRTEIFAPHQVRRQPTTRTVSRVSTCRCTLDRCSTVRAMDTTRGRANLRSIIRMAPVSTKPVSQSPSNQLKGIAKESLGNLSILLEPSRALRGELRRRRFYLLNIRIRCSRIFMLYGSSVKATYGHGDCQSKLFKDQFRQISH